MMFTKYERFALITLTLFLVIGSFILHLKNRAVVTNEEIVVDTKYGKRSLAPDELGEFVHKEKIIPINSASFPELISIPGIGRVTAGRIIKFRDTHGAFYDIKQLLDVKGISERKLETIKEYIIIDP